MTTICLAAYCLQYPTGAGHTWAYLNWALGFKALGCRVIWLENIGGDVPSARMQQNFELFRRGLDVYGLGNDIAVYSTKDSPTGDHLLEEAFQADLLVNFVYDAPAEVVGKFKRSALVDIDPGLLQNWIATDAIAVAPHDLYFTTGGTVARPGSVIPDTGLNWLQTVPCVSTRHWQQSPPADDAAFSTVSHWHASEWAQDPHGHFPNNKRDGFLPYLDLPKRTSVPLELALNLGDGDPHEKEILEGGWRLKEAEFVAGTPETFQHYVSTSLGEFSCAKPSCIRMQNGWISDRTLCYLAAGKPAVIEYTGPNTNLPSGEGVFRFRSVEEALAALDDVMVDYERHAKAARALAEERFDSQLVASQVLERALA